VQKGFIDFLFLGCGETITSLLRLFPEGYPHPPHSEGEGTDDPR